MTLAINQLATIPSEPVRFHGQAIGSTFPAGLEYWDTAGAKGVFIDVWPQPVATDDAHSGVCFNAGPRTSRHPYDFGPFWQKMEFLNSGRVEDLWWTGVALIFYKFNNVATRYLDPATGVISYLNGPNDPRRANSIMVEFFTNINGTPNGDSNTERLIIGNYADNKVLRCTFTKQGATAIFDVYELDTNFNVTKRVGHRTRSVPLATGGKTGVFSWKGGRVQAIPRQLFY